MKKLLVIIVIFIGVRELIVVSRNFVDNRVAEQDIQPEKIDLENINVRFNTLKGKVKGEKSLSTIGCVTTIYAKNKAGIDIEAGIEMANYLDDHDTPFVIYTTPDVWIGFTPDPYKSPEEPTLKGIVKGYFFEAIGLGYKPTVGWFKIDNYSTWKDFRSEKVSFRAGLTSETATLQDKIILEEKPFVLGFQNRNTKRIFAFEINPKGLIKPEDKEKYLACKAQILQRK